MMNMKGQIGDDAVFAAAKSVGLDVDRLKKDMATPEIEQQIKVNLALAKELDVRGTPTFIAGDQVVEGALDYAGLKDLIATARRK
jgi:protein-disulfide isomerase